jgi:hypothetical protein
MRTTEARKIGDGQGSSKIRAIEDKNGRRPGATQYVVIVTSLGLVCAKSENYSSHTQNIKVFKSLIWQPLASVS